jgi:hypothetical protein
MSSTFCQFPCFVVSLIIGGWGRRHENSRREFTVYIVQQISHIPYHHGLTCFGKLFCNDLFRPNFYFSHISTSTCVFNICLFFLCLFIVANYLINYIPLCNSCSEYSKINNGFMLIYVHQINQDSCITGMLP